MTGLPVIHELGNVIKPYMTDGILHSYEVDNLTQPGDNYGSLLLSVRALIQQGDGKLWEKRFVAKLPPTDPKNWAFVHPERTCLAENAIYERLAPALSALQEEVGLPKTAHFDGFAQYFGSRTSLNPNSNIVSNDAILVLEDLRDSNYLPGHRLRPLDLLHTQLALVYMARLHALTIALRLKKPSVFEKEVRPFFNKFDWHETAPDMKATMIEETLEDIAVATNNDQAIVALVRNLSFEFFRFLSAPPIADNPFNTVIHCDFWIMNLMFKYDSSGQPIQLKIIDFQTAQFDSVIHDLMSFLLTSVSSSILEDNYYKLIKYYYEAFIATLVRLDVKTNEYSYEAFTAELRRAAYIQIPHAIFMSRFILAHEASTTSNDLELSDVLKRNCSNRIHTKLMEILRLAQKFQIIILD